MYRSNSDGSRRESQVTAPVQPKFNEERENGEEEERTLELVARIGRLGRPTESK
jgi:hypothetical protein